jgi:NADH-quinone oxidoreductase subunit J
VTASLVVFSLLASVTVLGALATITRRNPVHAAIFLVITFFGVAGLYVLLEAEFLAAVQVLVYAGGILVLFLFVIMLVDLEERGRPPRDILGFRARHAVLSLGIAGAVLGLLSLAWATLPAVTAAPGDPLRGSGGNLEAVSVAMFQHNLLPFELASVLLLVAMIGAIVLAKPRI